MVRFNPGLSQILSKVFLSKNMSFELAKYSGVFTSRFSDDTKTTNKIFNPGLAPGGDPI